MNVNQLYLCCSKYKQFYSIYLNNKIGQFHNVKFGPIGNNFSFGHLFFMFKVMTHDQ